MCLFWYHPEALEGKVWLDHLEIVPVGHAAAICEHAPPIPQHVDTGPEVEFSLALSESSHVRLARDYEALKYFKLLTILDLQAISLQT